METNRRPAYRLELTHHRVDRPGELQETIAGYRACLTLSGPVTVVWKTGGREDRRELFPGDVCTEAPGGFRWVSWNAPLDFLRLEISPRMMAEVAGRNAIRKGASMAVHRGLRDSNLSTLMQMLRAAAAPEGTHVGHRLFCEHLGQTLAAYVYERFLSGSAKRQVTPTCLPGKVLKEVLSYINERLTEPVRVNDLAVLAGMSQFYFSRLFRNTVGRSPAQYILDRRVERASQLLEDTSLSMAAIARRTGFTSESSFASAFRARTGHTPSRYRRNLV